MENSVIAVQIANGTFVPVLNTASRKRRRLVVTTVRDNQTDVKIELFRGSDEAMADAEYVGSLLIENLEAAPEGSPDVAVLLGVDDTGNLNATATDTSSGEYQSLSVNLDQLREDGGYDVPDFQLSDEELTLDDLSLDEEDITLDVPTGDESDEFALDDLSEDAAPIAGSGSSDDDALGDLSFDDLEPEEDALDFSSLDESVGEEAIAEPAPRTRAGDDLEEMTLEEFTLDDEDEPIDIASEESDEALTLEDSSEDLSLEDVSFEEVEPMEESASGDDALVDFADEEISFDDSFSEEAATEAIDFASDESALGDFDLSELAEEESSDSAASEDEEFSIGDDSLEEGMVEADLGDEDFTFDESADDEPLFGEPESYADEESSDDSESDELEDTLSAEEFDRLDSEPSRELDEEDAPLQPRRSNALIFVGYLILALAALGVLTYLIFRLVEGPPAPPLHAMNVVRRVIALIPLAAPN